MQRSTEKPYRVLFLYTELAGYFLACLRQLREQYPVDIHVVHWPVNKEAPFVLEKDAGTFYDRTRYDRSALKDLVAGLSPDVIYCSGWIDKEYLEICSSYRSIIPVVLGLDNQWTGTFRQKLVQLFGRGWIRKRFSHCWVPGAPQERYARRIGFNMEKILKGFYSGDVARFSQYYEQSIAQKRTRFPRRFIYAGRYYSFKGVTDLWNAFVELQNEIPNDWELWCIGTGDLEPFHHPKIRHFGFIQPGDMESIIKNTGVFVLPSRFEPWGVVVHEFAAAGFPLLCSRAVGAAAEFLEEGVNGFTFEAGNKEQIKNALKRMMASSDEELLRMGEHSREKASAITPVTWGNTLMTLLEK